MARIRPPAALSSVVRLFLSLAAKATGKVAGKAVVTTPMTVMAHQSAILFGYGMLEAGQARAGTLPPKLKVLAAQLSGRLIGCPF